MREGITLECWLVACVIFFLLIEVGLRKDSTYIEMLMVPIRPPAVAPIVILQPTQPRPNAKAFIFSLS